MLQDGLHVHTINLYPGQWDVQDGPLIVSLFPEMVTGKQGHPQYY